jgi:hypothetical protein
MSKNQPVLADIDVKKILLESGDFSGKFPSYLAILEALQDSADQNDDARAATLRAILTDIEAKMAEATIDDLGTLADFGFGALADLTKVCEKMLQRQRVSGTFTASFDVLRVNQTSEKFEDMKRRVAEYLEDDAVPEERKGMLRRMFNSMSQAVTDMFGGKQERLEAEKKEKQARNERDQELILQDLRHQAVESIKLETELKNAQHQIKPILTSLDGLLRTQEDAYKQLLLYIIAGDEVMRRHETVDMVKAQEFLKENEGSVAAEANLANAWHIANALGTQLNELKMEYDSNIFLSQMIIDQKKHYETIDQMISDSLTNTLTLWKSLQRMQGLIKSEQDNAVREENLRNYRNDLMNKSNHTLRRIELNGTTDEAIQTMEELAGKFKQLDVMQAKLEETRERIAQAKASANADVMNAMNESLQVSLARLESQSPKPLMIEDNSERQQAQPEQAARRQSGPRGLPPKPQV